jgi:hypothetical protein
LFCLRSPTLGFRFKKRTKKHNSPKKSLLGYRLLQSLIVSKAKLGTKATKKKPYVRDGYGGCLAGHRATRMREGFGHAF